MGGVLGTNRQALCRDGADTGHREREGGKLPMCQTPNEGSPASSLA